MKLKISSLIFALLFLFSAPCWSEDNKAINAGEAPSVSPELITSAFGIQLGQHFQPSMVKQVIKQQQKTYTAKDGVKLEGSMLHVIPTTTDDRFQDYHIYTTKQGDIYAIRATYQFEVEPAMGKKMGQVKHARTIRKTCKNAVKTLASELESKHGKPRGKGWDGEWFNFRQISDTSDISVNLYANQCRTGKYSIVYTDKKLKHTSNPE